MTMRPLNRLWSERVALFVRVVPFCPQSSSIRTLTQQRRLAVRVCTRSIGSTCSKYVRYKLRATALRNIGRTRTLRTYVALVRTAVKELYETYQTQAS